MQNLRIEVDGRALSFPDGSVVRIGRSIDADVVLSAPSVSRAHAELRPTPTGWVLADAGSAGGTFVAGVPVRQLALAGTVDIQCGPPAPGSTLRVQVLAQPVAAPAPASPPSPAPVPIQMPPVQMPPAPTASASWPAPDQIPPAESDAERTIAPGMGVPVPLGMMAPPPSGPDLLLVAEGREHRFRHPAALTIGRARECSVVLEDQGVSRQHARVVAKPGGWVFENLSPAGSYLDGRPITRIDFDETTDLRLGHPVAGERLSLVPIHSAAEEVARFARRRRRRRLTIIGIAAALVLALGGSLAAVLVLTRSGEDSMDRLTAGELNAAQAATVLITAYEDTDQGKVAWTGSGSIIRKDGLILTNAHVAAPSADGLSELYGSTENLPDPEFVYVNITDPDNGYATDYTEPDYLAKVVAADGHVDAAVIKIYADGEGNDIDALDLPTMKLGDSDAMHTGDDVTILGFPGIATDLDVTEVKAPEVSVTRGVISTFLDREPIGKRSEIDTDARIAPGNSGGAAIDNDGRLIGIPSSTRQEEDEPIVSGRIRPLAWVTDLIDQAEQQD
ncbi:MAG: trypsin-like peptidase domain-containing protein [Nocardioides sp.]|uniref:FHA domain-containing protein n=1 Tax=Nocardioides sp. TaxID=35761 RepID=UPI0039E66104